MKIKLFISVVFLYFISICSIFALDKKAAVDELFIKSGLEYQLNNYAESAINGFDTQQRTSQSPFSAEEQVKIHELMREGLSVQNLSPMMKDYISTHLSDAAFDKSLNWLNSSLGSKITKYEEEASKPETMSKIKEYTQGLNSRPPSSDRMDLIKRFVEASNGEEFVYKIYATQADAMIGPLTQSTSPKDQENAQKLKFRIEMSKPQVEATAQQQLLIGGLYTYKDLSNDQLTQYINFLGSSEGKEFIQVTQQALIEGMKIAQQKIGNYYIELIHAKQKTSAEASTTAS